MNKAVLMLATLLVAVPCPAQDTPAVTASLSADRDRIFQWDPFTLTLTTRNTGVRLAPNAPISGLAPEGKLEILGELQELEPERTVLNRVTHTVRRWRVRVRALVPGQMTLAPTIEAREMTRVRSVLGAYYAPTDYPVLVAPLTITVLPIPETGKPASFSGAVGQLSFDVVVAPTELAVGDLVTATLQVRGDGYLDSMQPPSISPGRNFKAYDPKITKSGPDYRVYEQTVVPQSSNAVEIADVSFCFFDTGIERYRTITRGPFPLKFRAARVVVDDPYVPTGSDATGMEPPPPSDDLSDFTVVRQSRGLVNALIVSLLCAIVIGLGLAIRLKRGPAAMLLYFVVAVELAALCHVVRRNLLVRPLVIVSEQTQARIAPARTALVSFNLHRGCAVVVLETYDGWRKIEFKNKRGWIESALLSQPRVAE